MTLFLINYHYHLAPKILSLTPQDLTILAKGDAIFECKVVSFPTAQITWMKNSKKVVRQNRKFVIVNTPNVSYLRIRDASYSWSKNNLNITCIAENLLGRAQSSTILKTLPSIKKKPIIQLLSKYRVTR